jgi:MarR family 2-MHQ and catechol resistance regulon transcriptional repressor
MSPPASGTIVLKTTMKIEEKLNMIVDPELENLNLRVVRMVYRTYTRFENCLDRILRTQGLTTERYLVLLAVKYHDAPVRITDVAQWGERATNSVSTIVDRMVKAGLLRRMRDKHDRRMVNLFITDKGETALKPANIAALEFFRQIMSPLSREDGHTLLSLFRMINYKLLEYLNPGADIEGMLKNDSERQDYLSNQLK